MFSIQLSKKEKKAKKNKSKRLKKKEREREKKKEKAREIEKAKEKSTEDSSKKKKKKKTKGQKEEKKSKNETPNDKKDDSADKLKTYPGLDKEGLHRMVVGFEEPYKDLKQSNHAEKYAQVIQQTHVSCLQNREQAGQVNITEDWDKDCEDNESSFSGQPMDINQNSDPAFRMFGQNILEDKQPAKVDIDSSNSGSQREKSPFFSRVADSLKSLIGMRKSTDQVKLLSLSIF